MNPKIIERAPRRRGVLLILTLLALLAPMLLAAPSAQANETKPTDWEMRSLSYIEGAPSELSGVAVTSYGGIYAVDDDAGGIWCISNDGTGWSADKVTGLDDLFPPGTDLEGIADKGTNTLVVAQEKNSRTDRRSSIHEIGIQGTEGSPYRTTQLTDIADLPDLPNVPGEGAQQMGGAEGLVFTHQGDDAFALVREGIEVVDPDDQVSRAVPALYHVDLRSNTPHGDPVLLQARDAGGGPVTTDAAGVTREERDNGDLFVLSQQTKEIRKFNWTTGDQVGDPLSVGAMRQPEGLDMFHNGVQMAVIGEANGGVGSQIAILAQKTSQEPLPTGNCTGEQNVCTGASISAAPNPVTVGNTMTATVVTGSCDGYDIVETKVNVWNFTEIDWDSHVNHAGPLPIATFTGVPSVTGVRPLTATIIHEVRVYDGDGTTFTVKPFRQDVATTVTVLEQPPYADERTNVYLENVRFRTQLNDANGNVSLTRDGSLWDIMTLANGNVHIKNSTTGHYLDLDTNGGNVDTQPFIDAGTEWTITTRSNGNLWITNADLDAVRNRLRTHRFGRAYTSKWSGTYAQWVLVDAS